MNDKPNEYVIPLAKKKQVHRVKQVKYIFLVRGIGKISVTVY